MFLEGFVVIGMETGTYFGSVPSLQNNYRFDVVQIYCFRINIKL